MFNTVIETIRQRQLRAHHDKILSQLKSLEWDKEFAIRSMKESFSSIISAANNGELEEIMSKVSFAFSEQLNNTPTLSAAIVARLANFRPEIADLYIVDVQLNALRLEEGVCLCSDDLHGTIKAVFRLQSIKKGISRNGNPFLDSTYIWESKKWKCDSISI